MPVERVPRLGDREALGMAEHAAQLGLAVDPMVGHCLAPQPCCDEDTIIGALGEGGVRATVHIVAPPPRATTTRLC